MVSPVPPFLPSFSCFGNGKERGREVVGEERSACQSASLLLGRHVLVYRRITREGQLLAIGLGMETGKSEMMCEEAGSSAEAAEWICKKKAVLR